MRLQRGRHQHRRLSASSLQKGETLKDTALNLSGPARRYHRPAAQFRPERPTFSPSGWKPVSSTPGTAPMNIPPRDLLDIFTMREKCGKIEGLNVSIVGDILFRPRGAFEHPRSG